MDQYEGSCPLSRKKALELYFTENRARLLDLAAFLDRLDRCQGKDLHDFRMEAFREALKVLSDGKPGRAERALSIFSDLSEAPIESARGMKGACGACPGRLF